MDEVLLNKMQIIKNCLRQIKRYYIGFETDFEADLMRQDAIILNLQRACEASIDFALRLIAIERLGLPQDSRGAFAILEKEGWLSPTLCLKLQRMVGFRNIAVHDYQKVNLDVLRSILERHLADFEALLKEITTKYRRDELERGES